MPAGTAATVCVRRQLQTVAALTGPEAAGVPRVARLEALVVEDPADLESDRLRERADLRVAVDERDRVGEVVVFGRLADEDQRVGAPYWQQRSASDDIW